MNLVIDVGNTRTKAGIFEGNDLVWQTGPGDHKAVDIAEATANYKIDYCIFSSVVQDNSMTEILDKQFPVLVLEEKTNLPFVNNYKTPATLGNDRKANIAGAAKLFPGKNVLVLDAGTCLKTDFLNSDARYAGGSISPGLQMRFSSLKHFTARLPLVSYRPFQEYCGTTTEESILAGVICGLNMEMEGFIQKYTADFSDLQIILTGGDAHFFDKTLKNSIFVAPYLALTGLNVILNYNVEKNKI